MRLQIDWANFVFESNFPGTSPRGAYIWRGDLTEGFFASLVRGAYIWRGLYLEGLIFGILRYLILIGKLYLWDCGKRQVLPNIEVFKFKVKIKYQVEKYISTH